MVGVRVVRRKAVNEVRPEEVMYNMLSIVMTETNQEEVFCLIALVYN